MSAMNPAVPVHIKCLAFLCFALAVSLPASGEEVVIPAKQSWWLSGVDDTGAPELLESDMVFEVGTDEIATNVTLLSFELLSDLKFDADAEVVFEIEIESSNLWGGIWVNLYGSNEDPKDRPLSGMSAGEMPIGIIVEPPRAENPRGTMYGKVSLPLTPEAVYRLWNDRKLVLVLHGSPPQFTRTIYRVFSESSDSPPVLRIAQP